MKLAREIHAGNPDVWPEVDVLLREEADHVEKRATQHVAGLAEGQRRYWERLLSENSQRQ